MFLTHRRLGRGQALAVIALMAHAAFAQAQPQAPTQPARNGRADPLDAQARVPAATHVSALARYRRLGDEPRIGWQEANETVNRIGGWRAYAREAQAPEPSTPAPANRPSPAPVPASSPAPAHRGHPQP